MINRLFILFFMIFSTHLMSDDSSKKKLETNDLFEILDEMTEEYGEFFLELVNKECRDLGENIEELVRLFNFAIENKDLKLAEEVIEVLSRIENGKLLMDSILKYNDQGKFDFALHNAIMDNNIVASMILTHYSKDINSRKSGSEVIWTNQFGTSKT